ncbi:hypothetical protein Psuf_013510 [Phytohabitans suffuscus]|uniref:Uncharacterized protein n=1 Tax=Phytohabitans suffuscus TaxID=624315 RepID=A0A6F8YDI8_9ACTN|nr:hypothetical protein Psuf_013510 [Phytohabitans suffuscus]
MRELEAGDDVADREDVGHAGAQAVVGEDEAALHLDPLLLVADAGRGRAAADRDEQQLSLERLAAGDRHADPVVGRLDLFERLAGLEADATLAECPLDRLRSLLVLGGEQPGSASTIVTSLPSERHALANSTPITPPPSTIAEVGTRSRLSACSLEMTRLPSSSRPGRVREYDPVASTTLRPV